MRGETPILDTLLKAKDYSASQTDVELRSALGGLLNMDWRSALIARGYGWGFDTVATFATPITGGGAGTVMDLDQPELGISVPLGWTLIPLRIRLSVNPGVSVADNEVTEACLVLDRTAAFANDGTTVSERPINLRTNIASGCPATCFSAGTVNITVPIVSAVLDHVTVRANFGDNTGMSLEHCDLLYEPESPPLVVGPGAIYGYFGGTVATTGYGSAVFLVIPSELVTRLS